MLLGSLEVLVTEVIQYASSLVAQFKSELVVLDCSAITFLMSTALKNQRIYKYLQVLDAIIEKGRVKVR